MAEVDAEALEQRDFGEHEANTDEGEVKTAANREGSRTVGGSAPKGDEDGENDGGDGD